MLLDVFLSSKANQSNSFILDTYSWGCVLDGTRELYKKLEMEYFSVISFITAAYAQANNIICSADETAQEK